MSAYRDRDGDVWTQQDDGRFTCPANGDQRLTLASIAENFSPLTELREEAEPVDNDTSATTTPTMTRTEALARATEHINSLATNARGYQDGVRFADKVAAVERLARFLMGEAAPEGGA